LADRASVYRHAHALGLFLKRQRNIRAALERIIEHAGEVEVTASGVVSAVQAYSKINAAGQWIERSEHVNLNELFERMTQQELESSCPRLRQSLRPNHLPMARNAVSALRVRSACRSGSHKLRLLYRCDVSRYGPSIRIGLFRPVRLKPTREYKDGNSDGTEFRSIAAYAGQGGRRVSIA